MEYIAKKLNNKLIHELFYEVSKFTLNDGQNEDSWRSKDIHDENVPTPLKFNRIILFHYYHL